MTKKGIVMKQRFILFRRSGVFYYEDTTTGKQLSLHTKDEAEADTLYYVNIQVPIKCAVFGLSRPQARPGQVT